MNGKRSLWVGLFWFNWGVILFFWLYGSGALLLQGWPSVAIALGRLFGLGAAYMVLMQFFLMGRNPLLEGVFGLDKLSVIHRRHGIYTAVFFIFHPILLLGGYGALSNTNPVAQFLDFFNNYEKIPFAVLGFIGLLVVIVTSIEISRRKLKYETWYIPHLLVYFSVFFFLQHQFTIGPDLLTHRVFYGYWVLLYAFVLGSHLVFRFLRPLYRLYRHRFYIADVDPENSDVTSLYIRGKAMEKFTWKSGQFGIFRFLTPKLWWQAHPFSFSVPVNAKEARLSIKAVGDFTRDVRSLTPGVRVLIDGPYGVFTDRVREFDKILFIAGGIGITPIRALLEEEVRAGKDVILIYGNRTEGDIVFREEFEDLARKFPLKVFHILSQETKPGFLSGYVDEEKLKSVVPDLLVRDVYLCGPVPMMEGVRKALGELGVPPERVHFERFAF